MRNLEKIIAVSFASMVLVGCINTSKEPVQITRDQCDAMVVLKLGQQFVVSLPSNPSTGYSWTIKHRPENIEGSDEAIFKSAGAVPGRGGQALWTYRASKIGTDRLQMVYERPWIKEAEPADIFECKIIVE